MNRDVLQQIRYKLQKRMRKLRGYEGHDRHFMLQQFAGYLTSHQMISDILAMLVLRVPDGKSTADKVIHDRQRIGFPSELEQAGVSYWVLKGCVETADPNIEITIGHKYKVGQGSLTIDWQAFLTHCVEPLYEFVDEQLDDQGAALALVRRYKQKCEWFHRGPLYSLWSADPTHGEAVLVNHFYDYMHDQGTQLTIEPKSASGRVDLLADQVGEQRLVADAKIFDPKTGRGVEYISKGFGQLHSYMRDHNETFGFLIVYKVADHGLSYDLTGSDLWLPFHTHNGRTVFFVTIDIHLPLQSASKGGAIRTSVIDAKQLIRCVDEPEIGHSAPTGGPPESTPDAAPKA